MDFYEIVEKKKAEIDTLDIPEDVKKALYGDVEETIARFEKLKRKGHDSYYSLSPLKAKMVGKGLEGLFRQFERVYYNISDILTNIKNKSSYQ